MPGTWWMSLVSATALAQGKGNVRTADNGEDVRVEIFTYFEHPPGDGIVQSNAGDADKLGSVILEFSPQLPGMVLGHQEIQNLDLNTFSNKDTG